MERFPRTPFLLSVFGAVFLGSRCFLAQAEQGAFCPVSEKEVAARFAWPDQLEAVNTFLSLGDREKEKRFKLEEEAEDEDEGEASGGFENVEEEFYSLLSDPFQSKCQISKNFGGRWIERCAFLDGVKFVCMDKIFGDIVSGRCLVYSFGIGQDWSFEDALADLGCQVRAFDPTVLPRSPENPNISFKMLALGHKTGLSRLPHGGLMANTITLEDSFKLFGDENRTISYLKVDVEGSELEAFPLWTDDVTSNNVLGHVDQLCMEFHTRRGGDKPTPVKTFQKLVKATRQLYKLGLKLIDYSANSCVERRGDKADGKYNTFFDAVFYRS